MLVAGFTVNYYSKNHSHIQRLRNRQFKIQPFFSEYRISDSPKTLRAVAYRNLFYHDLWNLQNRFIDLWEKPCKKPFLPGQTPLKVVVFKTIINKGGGIFSVNFCILLVYQYIASGVKNSALKAVWNFFWKTFYPWNRQFEFWSKTRFSTFPNPRNSP